MITRSLFRLARWAHKLRIHRLTPYSRTAEWVKGRLFETSSSLGRCRRLDLDGRHLLVPYALAHHYLGHPFEPETTEYVRWALEPGMTFVDVGANIGYFTLLAAIRVGPGGRVLALEPAPDNLRCLTENIQTNALDQVRVIPCAAGSESCKRSFYLRSANLIHSFYSEGVPMEREIRVEQVALDGLVEGRVDLIKVDVEGAEPEVLAGMEGLMRRTPPPDLIVEWNPSALSTAGHSEAAVPEILTQRGFRLRLLDAPSGPSTLEQALRGARSLPKSWYANVLATR